MGPLLWLQGGARPGAGPLLWLQGSGRPVKGPALWQQQQSDAHDTAGARDPGG